MAYLVLCEREKSDLKIRYNVEMYEIFDDRAVSILVKLHKMGWVNHMDRAGIRKRTSKSEDTLSQEKPRTRWSDRIYDYNSTSLGFGNLRTAEIFGGKVIWMQDCTYH